MWIKLMRRKGTSEIAYYIELGMSIPHKENVKKEIVKDMAFQRWQVSFSSTKFGFLMPCLHETRLRDVNVISQ